eukprot:Anaeramoba_ignava/a89918_223.p1 GENE.a89918_223~~a89918_223.p1  ORF type:complete len:3086 (-),score=931.20 a89918_223:65-9322(-)
MSLLSEEDQKSIVIWFRQLLQLEITPPITETQFLGYTWMVLNKVSSKRVPFIDFDKGICSFNVARINEICANLRIPRQYQLPNDPVIQDLHLLILYIAALAQQKQLEPKLQLSSTLYEQIVRTLSVPIKHPRKIHAPTSISLKIYHSTIEMNNDALFIVSLPNGAVKVYVSERLSAFDSWKQNLNFYLQTAIVSALKSDLSPQFSLFHLSKGCFQFFESTFPSILSNDAFLDHIYDIISKSHFKSIRKRGSSTFFNLLATAQEDCIPYEKLAESIVSQGGTYFSVRILEEEEFKDCVLVVRIERFELIYEAKTIFQESYTFLDCEKDENYKFIRLFSKSSDASINIYPFSTTMTLIIDATIRKMIISPLVSLLKVSRRKQEDLQTDLIPKRHVPMNQMKRISSVKRTQSFFEFPMIKPLSENLRQVVERNKRSQHADFPITLIQNEGFVSGLVSLKPGKVQLHSYDDKSNIIESEYEKVSFVTHPSSPTLFELRFPDGNTYFCSTNTEEQATVLLHSIQEIKKSPTSLQFEMKDNQPQSPVKKFDFEDDSMTKFSIDPDDFTTKKDVDQNLTFTKTPITSSEVPKLASRFGRMNVLRTESGTFLQPSQNIENFIFSSDTEPDNRKQDHKSNKPAVKFNLDNLEEFSKDDLDNLERFSHNDSKDPSKFNLDQSQNNENQPTLYSDPKSQKQNQFSQNSPTYFPFETTTDPSYLNRFQSYQHDSEDENQSFDQKDEKFSFDSLAQPKDGFDFNSKKEDFNQFGKDQKIGIDENIHSQQFSDQNAFGFKKMPDNEHSKDDQMQKFGEDDEKFDNYGYNKHGYDKDGFDKDGFDKHGFNKDGYDKDGFDKRGYDKKGYDGNGFDKHGFNNQGFGKDGYDKDGFDNQGFDKKGFDKQGFDKDGYDQGGFDTNGFDRKGNRKPEMEFEKADRIIETISLPNTSRSILSTNEDSLDQNEGPKVINQFDGDERDEFGFDKNGFDPHGFDKDGYDKDGYDRNGFDKDGYNSDGFDRNGFDRRGYNKDGFDRHGFDEDGYNLRGFDRYGFDKEGYDHDGYNKDGYDRDGFDRDGFDHDGYNRDGFDRNGFDKQGFDVDGHGVDLFSPFQGENILRKTQAKVVKLMPDEEKIKFIRNSFVNRFVQFDLLIESDGRFLPGMLTLTSVHFEYQIYGKSPHRRVYLPTMQISELDYHKAVILHIREPSGLIVTLKTKDVNHKFLIVKTFQMFQWYTGDAVENCPLNGEIIGEDYEIEALTQRIMDKEYADFSVKFIDSMERKHRGSLRLERDIGILISETIPSPISFSYRKNLYEVDPDETDKRLLRFDFSQPSNTIISIICNTFTQRKLIDRCLKILIHRLAYPLDVEHHLDAKYLRSIGARMDEPKQGVSLGGPEDMASNSNTSNYYGGIFTPLQMQSYRIKSKEDNENTIQILRESSQDSLAEDSMRHSSHRLSQLSWRFSQPLTRSVITDFGLANQYKFLRRFQQDNSPRYTKRQLNEMMENFQILASMKFTQFSKSGSPKYLQSHALSPITDDFRLKSPFIFLQSQDFKQMIQRLRQSVLQGKMDFSVAILGDIGYIGFFRFKPEYFKVKAGTSHEDSKTVYQIKYSDEQTFYLHTIKLNRVIFKITDSIKLVVVMKDSFVRDTFINTFMLFRKLSLIPSAQERRKVLNDLFPVFLSPRHLDFYSSARSWWSSQKRETNFKWDPQQEDERTQRERSQNQFDAEEHGDTTYNAILFDSFGQDSSSAKICLRKKYFTVTSPAFKQIIARRYSPYSKLFFQNNLQCRFNIDEYSFLIVGFLSNEVRLGFVLDFHAKRENMSPLILSWWESSKKLAVDCQIFLRNNLVQGQVIAKPDGVKLKTYELAHSSLLASKFNEEDIDIAPEFTLKQDTPPNEDNPPNKNIPLGKNIPLNQSSIEIENDEYEKEKRRNDPRSAPSIPHAKSLFFPPKPKLVHSPTETQSGVSDSKKPKKSMTQTQKTKETRPSRTSSFFFRRKSSRIKHQDTPRPQESLNPSDFVDFQIPSQSPKENTSEPKPKLFRNLNNQSEVMKINDGFLKKPLSLSIEIPQQEQEIPAKKQQPLIFNQKRLFEFEYSPSIQFVLSSKNKKKFRIDFGDQTYIKLLFQTEDDARRFHKSALNHQSHFLHFHSTFQHLQQIEDKNENEFWPRVIENARSLGTARFVFAISRVTLFSDRNTLTFSLRNFKVLDIEDKTCTITLRRENSDYTYNLQFGDQAELDRFLSVADLFRSRDQFLKLKALSEQHPTYKFRVGFYTEDDEPLYAGKVRISIDGVTLLFRHPDKILENQHYPLEKTTFFVDRDNVEKAQLRSSKNVFTISFQTATDRSLFAKRFTQFRKLKRKQKKIEKEKKHLEVYDKDRIRKRFLSKAKKELSTVTEQLSEITRPDLNLARQFTTLSPRVTLETKSIFMEPINFKVEIRSQSVTGNEFKPAMLKIEYNLLQVFYSEDQRPESVRVTLETKFSREKHIAKITHNFLSFELKFDSQQNLGIVLRALKKIQKVLRINSFSVFLHLPDQTNKKATLSVKKHGVIIKTSDKQLHKLPFKTKVNITINSEKNILILTHKDQQFHLSTRHLAQFPSFCQRLLILDHQHKSLVKRTLTRHSLNLNRERYDSSKTFRHSISHAHPIQLQENQEINQESEIDLDDLSSQNESDVNLENQNNNNNFDNDNQKPILIYDSSQNQDQEKEKLVPENTLIVNPKDEDDSSEQDSSEDDIESEKKNNENDNQININQDDEDDTTEQDSSEIESETKNIQTNNQKEDDSIHEKNKLISSETMIIKEVDSDSSQQDEKSKEDNLEVKHKKEESKQALIFPIHIVGNPPNPKLKIKLYDEFFILKDPEKNKLSYEDTKLSSHKTKKEFIKISFLNQTSNSSYSKIIQFKNQETAELFSLKFYEKQKSISFPFFNVVFIDSNDQRIDGQLSFKNFSLLVKIQNEEFTWDIEKEKGIITEKDSNFFLQNENQNEKLQILFSDEKAKENFIRLRNLRLDSFLIKIRKSTFNLKISENLTAKAILKPSQLIIQTDNNQRLELELNRDLHIKTHKTLPIMQIFDQTQQEIQFQFHSSIIFEEFRKRIGEMII